MGKVIPAGNTAAALMSILTGMIAEAAIIKVKTFSGKGI